MNEEERMNEEIDVDIFDGEPDMKAPQVDAEGVQDDGEEFDEDYSTGEAVGSQITDHGIVLTDSGEALGGEVVPTDPPEVTL